MVAPTAAYAGDETICYAAADAGNRLVSISKPGGGFVDIGPLGVPDVEAISYRGATDTLYGADADTLGLIDLLTGAFTAVGGTFGLADGALGTITITDVDGLHFDAFTGILYGSHRRGGATAEDLLIQIDITTGLVVQDAFGVGVDYVVINAGAVTGFYDIDDIAVDPTDGTMFGIANNGGVGDHLVVVDKTTGLVTDIGPLFDAASPPDPVQDFEGLSVSNNGALFGTTGTTGLPVANSLYDLDKTTAGATLVDTFTNYAPYTDYEGVGCTTADANSITGTVFADLDSDGVYEPGLAEFGLSGVTVRLYVDENNDGVVDGGDTLIQTEVTDSTGFYEFFLSSEGDYVVDIDTTTLPAGWSLTTDNVETANFVGFGNTDTGNDFGAIGASDLTVSKTSNANALGVCPGDTIEYTVTVTNNGVVTQTGVTVTDPQPTDTGYVAQSTEADGDVSNDALRVTEYFIAAGNFTATSYDLTLNQDLATNYFVIVQGSDGDGSGGNGRGPDENYARLTQDPFPTGDLGTSTGGPDVITLERDNAVDSWVGVVTVVECLTDCSGSGFQLLDVQEVFAPNGDTSGSDTSAVAWSDIDQAMLMGGFNGAGCTTPDGTTSDTAVCHKRIFPSGTTTINWTRDSGDGNDNEATSTVMVLEWGSDWTVQRVQVQDTSANAGDGADDISEYTTAAINPVARDNTWVWGTGFTNDQGIGDAAEGVLITLGDGVDDSTSPQSTVAVGLEHTGNDIDFEVYALTHSDLAVDYRFKTDGDAGVLTFDVTVDTATADRMALAYNGSNGTGNAYPRPMWSARYFDDTTVRLERRRSGQEFPAWVQGIDFSGIGGGTAATIKDNIPAGVNPDLIDGNPSDLVETGDSFVIPPADTLTVTWEALVGDPLPLTTAIISNGASAESSQALQTGDIVTDAVYMSSVAGVVWFDEDQDTVQDVGELGIDSLDVTLYAPGPDQILGTVDDVVVAVDTTDIAGAYSFTGLVPGQYRVEVDETELTSRGFTLATTPGSAPVIDYATVDTCRATVGDGDFGYWGASPTPVTLGSFRASAGGGGTLVEWSTATEAGNVGFNIWALTAAGWQRANREPIPSRVIDSVTPQSYEYEVSGLAAEWFFIEDLNVKGGSELHGPFRVGRHHGSDPEALEPIGWPAIRAEHDAKRRQRRRALGVRDLPAGVVDGRDRVDVTRSRDLPRRVARARGPGGSTRGPVVNLTVERDGVYRLTYERLRDAGIELLGVPAESLALMSQARPVPIHVGGGEVFGPGSYVEFVGRGLDTLYTKTNVYTLIVRGAPGTPIELDSREANPAEPAVAFYTETSELRRQRAYSFAAPNGDPWYDTAMLAFTSPVSYSFDLEIDGLIEGAAPANLEVEMWGTTDWPESPDHHVEVVFNQVALADELFDGLTDHPVAVKLPAGLLEEGLNTLELNLPGDTGVRWDLVSFEGISVTYPRRFVAREGRLGFRATGQVFRVDGLPSPDVVVYRLDARRVVRLEGVRVRGGARGYSVTFRGSTRPANYLVAAVESLMEPGLRPIRRPSRITRGQAQYLMISHPDFVEGLERLVAAREDDGWSVKVVDVEDLYAQLSHGIFDPEAIRAYIAYAAEELGTEAVLLVGGDTYDYHDYLGLGSLSFIPTLYAATGDIVRFAPADSLFADVDEDGVPDVAIGRFPVRTSEDLEILIGKTLDFAAKTYDRTGVFTADDAAGGNVSFSLISEALAAKLPPGWSIERAYLDQLEVVEARQRLIDAINNGVALTSFFGHSGPNVWTFDNLFSTAHVDLLSNAGMPTVVTQWGCWNTYYVDPHLNTLGHKLLLSEDRGAAAVLGAATLTYSSSDKALGELFVPRAVSQGKTVGEALRDAKQLLAQEHPEMIDVLLGWALLGDPGLILEP